MAVENDRLRSGVCLKLAALDGGFVPVQDSRLRNIGEGAVLDLQNTAVIVLHGVQATGEGAAIDRQFRVCGLLGTIRETVFNHTGEMAGMIDFHTVIDGHGTPVNDVVVRVAATVVGIGALLLTAAISTAIEDYRAAHIVVDGCLLMGQVIHRAGALDGQRTVIGDGVVGHIGQLAALCEFKNNVLVSGDRQILADITLQGDARFNAARRRVNLILQRTGQRCNSAFFVLRRQRDPRFLKTLC